MISIIIPVYNAESTLSDTVRAVLQQSWSDLELILVNDGSRDGSGALCDRFAAEDARIRVFHQENRGVSAARNLGLSQVSGEYVTFLDADDVIPQDYLQVLRDACTGADIAVCDVVSIQDGRELTRFTLPDSVLTRTEALEFLLTRRKINSGPCAKLFRREVLAGLQFPPLKAYEDILFAREAFCNARRIAATDRTEYRYIQNPAGAMSGFTKSPSTDIIRATETLLEFIGCHPELSPECFYITASHLMQYAQPLATLPEGRGFLRESRKLYRNFMGPLLRCPAFPFKEKIVYLLFAWGWLYAGRRLTWIGGT